MPQDPIPELRYKIEHGIKIPKSKQEIAKVFELMEVGDSFSIVGDTTALHNFYSTAYMCGIKIRIRARRIWRVK